MPEPVASRDLPAADAGRGWRRLFVFACFFFTGSFGLVYEVVWSRYLALMVGNAAHASLAVLSTYMGGLALGAALFGRFADRAKNCFAAYGWIEIGVGLYGAAFPLLFPGMVAATLPIGQALGPGTASLTAFKILFAILCILLPTILMGGTLPLLTRFLSASPARLRKSVSTLYALNSAGAVVGSLMAGFYLIVKLGLPGALHLVGALNVALGLTVILVSRRLAAASEEPAPAATAVPAIDDLQYGAAERRAAVALAGFSGFTGMALEIAWIRYFTLLLGSTTYAFTIMLAAFISGITIGAWWFASRRAGRVPLIPLTAGALYVSALFLGASLMLYDRLPYAFYRVQQLLRPSADAYPLYQVITYALCFVSMLLPTTATGLVFPAAVRLAARSRALGRGVGAVYGVNTVCALAGSAITALVLFHWIGLENIFRVLIVAYALAGGLLFLLPNERPRRAWALVAFVLLAAHLAFYHPLDARLLNQGLYRMRQGKTATFANLRQSVGREQLLFLGEGPHAMVAVRQLGQANTMLTVNGKVDASTDLNGGDMYTQILIGHLPMLMHPHPRDAFVLGLGSGITAGAVLAHGVQVDLAEISPEVVEAEPFFRHANNDPLHNPRLRLFVDDAKSVLNFQQRQYDVIVSEPTNPWIAGVAGLFSTEFFTLVKSRLRPGGVFAQWMHSYETTDEALSLVVATLLDSFRYVYVFEPINGDYIFVATETPAGDVAAWRERLALPAVRADLARIHADDPAVLLSTQIKTPARLRLDVPPIRPNSDLRPVLEYRAPLGVFLGTATLYLATRDDRRALEPGMLADDYLKRFPLKADSVRKLVAYYQNYEANAPQWSAVLRLARQYLGDEAPETQQVFARMRQTGAWSFALGYWDNFRLPAQPTVSAVRERLDIGLSFFEERFYAWAPPDPTPLLEMIEWLETQRVDVYDYRARLAGALCNLGYADHCERMAAWFELNAPVDPARQPGTQDGRPSRAWQIEAAMARFRLALRRWDVAGAQKQLEVLQRFGKAGDPAFGQMTRLLAREAAVQRFYSLSW